MADRVKVGANGSFAFFCPGCKEIHVIYISGDVSNHPVWKWNGNLEVPTIEPSIAVHGQLYGPDKLPFSEYTGPYPCETNASVCHSFIENGRIKFLDDCTHALANTEVDIPEWDLENGELVE